MKKSALIIIAIAVMMLASLVAVPLTASAQGPVAHVAIPPHPFMAPNGVSNMHNDAYMTDTYEVSGPLGIGSQVTTSSSLGFKLTVTITFDQFGRLVAVVQGADGWPALKLFDPDTLEVLASYDLPERPYPIADDEISINFDPSGGVYFYLDNNYNVVVATNDYKIQVIQVPSEDLSTGFQVLQEYDVSSGVRDLSNDTPPDRDKLGPALSDWGGDYYFYSTRYGIVGLVNKVTGVIQTYDLRLASGMPEQTQNSPAVAEDGFYIVSDYAMYRFSVDGGGNLVLDWRTTYDRGTRLKPGMITQGCGPSPTLIGDLVAIADNADPMNVLFLRRDTGAQVASIPVFDDLKYDLAAGIEGDGLYASTTENTLIGVQRDADNYSVIVENNYGYLSFADTLGADTLIGGVTRIDVVHEGGGVYTASEVWESDARSLTPVPKMSLESGLVFLYTKPPVDAWFFTALDFETGATEYNILIGSGLFANNNWAPITLGPDGRTAYIGTLTRLNSIRDTYPVTTATGTGTAFFSPNAVSGPIENLTAIAEGSLACSNESRPDLEFQHGFFSFDVTGLSNGETVDVTITLPYALPAGSEYWKCHPTEGGWVQIPMSSNDGDNVIVITLVDGGLGDDDGVANGTIVDQGGPGQPPVTAATSVPVFPSVYIGIAAALGAGVLAYLYRRRVLGRKTTEI